LARFANEIISPDPAKFLRLHDGIYRSDREACWEPHLNLPYSEQNYCYALAYQIVRFTVA